MKQNVFFFKPLAIIICFITVIGFAPLSHKASASTGPDPMTSSQIDSFTIGQGEKFLNEYLKKHNLDYTVGSKEYIEFLNSIPFVKEDSSIKTDPNYQIIDAYASVYLENLDYALLDNPDLKLFQLDQSIKDKTIKEIRLHNNERDARLENKVNSLARMSKLSGANTLSSSFSRSRARSYMESYWDSTNGTFGHFSDDCTNYASQIVWYAGMSMDGHAVSSGHHSSTTDWYNQSLPSYGRGYTTSWTVVRDFYSYWAGHRGHSHRKFTGHAGIASYGATGDPIILRNQHTGSWHHTVVYNYVDSSGNVKYSAHTNNHLHYSLAHVNGYDYDFYVIKF